ncbi:hypothetical protein [Acetobacter pasteurianus]|uniref:hypothetical protein n=1 Tax=Acetobacter TaxID=434 RepID=UPI0012D7BDAA|nr:hypothetical protein [Acetobacter pasteurianus]
MKTISADWCNNSATSIGQSKKESKMAELKKTLCLASMCVALSMTACTPYKSLGIMGGVKATQIDDHIFEVASYVNGFSSHQLEHDYLLRKAAEVSLQAGCTYFVAVGTNEQNFMQVPQGTTEGLLSTQSGIVYVSSSGNAYRIVKPNVVNTIACFNRKPTAVLPGLVYNAHYVLNSLK